VHFAFGAGSRMCIGSLLAYRQLYVVFLRIIVAFEIHLPSNPSDTPILDAFGCSAVLTSFALVAKDFKVNMQPRNEGKLREWIAKSEELTKDL
jgi:phenylacetate 2-hydroxylase